MSALHSPTGKSQLLATCTQHLHLLFFSGAYSCTSNGALRITKLPTSASKDVSEASPSHTAVLPMRLADWALSSSGHTFAYAGDEVELSVWDTERAFAARESRPTTSAGEGKKKRKRGEELLPGETWRARNVCLI